MKKSIFELSDIDKIKEMIENKRVVLVGGCFDILHIGHITFLTKAKETGDILVVALESDEFIRTRKKREPFHTQAQRAEVLNALEAVDYVINLPLLKTDEAYSDLVKKVKPAIIAITEGDSHVSQKEKHAQLVGGQVKVVCPSLSSFSTSNVISYANLKTIFSD